MLQFFTSLALLTRLALLSLPECPPFSSPLLVKSLKTVSLKIWATSHLNKKDLGHLSKCRFPSCFPELQSLGDGAQESALYKHTQVIHTHRDREHMLLSPIYPKIPTMLVLNMVLMLLLCDLVYFVLFLFHFVSYQIIMTSVNYEF
jgi:hypothetical protein